MIANEALWGNHQGQYPVEGKATLESAAEDLESLADRIKTSAITDMTQEIYDDAIAAADKKLQEVENPHGRKIILSGIYLWMVIRVVTSTLDIARIL